MKPTSAALLRSIASRIHPQVILSHGESKRLLDTLKTSFRHHLDVEHCLEQVKIDFKDRKTPLSYTDRHVASVLTNPLLVTERPSLDQAGRRSDMSRNVRHPIEILKETMAHGTATLEIVRQCLVAFKRSLRPLAPASRYQAVNQHGAGALTLQWLWATGQATFQSSDIDEKLCEIVIFFLLREGKEHAVWNWIASAEHATSSEKQLLSSDATPLHATLLQQLVKCTIKSSRGNTDSAIAAFKKKIHSQFPSQEALRQALFPAATTLVDTLIDSAAKGPESKLELIHDFLDTSDKWLSSSLEPLAVDVMRARLRFFGAESIDAAIDLAKMLDLQSTSSYTGEYGSKLSQYLIELSECIQNHGSKSHTNHFVNLLRNVEAEQTNHKDSILSLLTRGIPPMLVQDIKAWRPDATEAAVPG